MHLNLDHGWGTDENGEIGRAMAFGRHGSAARKPWHPALSGLGVSLLPARIVQQRHDLTSGSSVGLASPSHSRGKHGATSFLDSSAGHAGVGGLNDDSHTFRADFFHQQIRDLRRQSLLNLW